MIATQLTSRGFPVIVSIPWTTGIQSAFERLQFILLWLGQCSDVVINVDPGNSRARVAPETGQYRRT